MAEYIRGENGDTIPFPPRSMTEAEFLACEAAEDVRAEWVDGICYQLIPPDERHQNIAGFLQCLIGLYARRLQRGKVYPARFEMRLPLPNRRCSYRQLDIMFVAKEHFDRITRPRLEGPAELVVEIVGDDTAMQDLDVKLHEYAHAGVAEYWIVDPRTGRPVFRAYELVFPGKYRGIAPDQQGRINSHALYGPWIIPSWLSAVSLPDPLELLAAMAPEQFGGYRRPID